MRSKRLVAEVVSRCLAMIGVTAEASSVVMLLRMAATGREAGGKRREGIAVEPVESNLTGEGEGGGGEGMQGNRVTEHEARLTEEGTLIVFITG